MHSLLEKYPKTVQGLLEHTAAFEEIAASEDAKTHGKEWSKSAQTARDKRNRDMKHVGGMKVYDLDRKKCMFMHRQFCQSISYIAFTVPTQRAILNELTKKERAGTVSEAGWIASGLRIQLLQ